MSTQRTAGFEEWEQQWMEYDTFEEVTISMRCAGTVVFFSQGGGSSVASDLSLNDRAVHVDFFNGMYQANSLP